MTPNDGGWIPVCLPCLVGEHDLCVGFDQTCECLCLDGVRLWPRPTKEPL